MIAAGLSAAATYAEWRDKAHALLIASVAPEHVVWTAADAPGLFADSAPVPEGNRSVSVPRAFVDVARKAVLHSDRERFALLYRLLWRLQANRLLMDDASDPDVCRVRGWVKAVRRDEHKMHAFVRFKEVSDGDDTRFIAWFEPQHHILAETADFFVRRFAGMRWSIVTPEASAHWDGEQLRMAPGGARADVPAEDARDEDWRTYYRSMFNPARLKVAAMKREMPKHYWKNMPETREIAGLVAAASSREGEMVEAEPTLPRKRAGAAHALIAPRMASDHEARVSERGAPPTSMEELTAALNGCRACSLWRPATQVVPGEGRTDSPLLAFVGEQPGDQEDLAGRAFVGPAGQLLNRALDAAGIDRSEAFLTNAVKHFKFEPRGKRRIHSKPGAGEVQACRWWVSHELSLVKPRLTVALGATAASSLAGYNGPLHALRGRVVQTREGAPLFVTVHPSYLLRLPDAAAKEREYARFVVDLGEAKASAARLAGGEPISALLKAS
jgi:probable DNA metabolism protein